MFFRFVRTFLFIFVIGAVVQAQQDSAGEQPLTIETSNASVSAVNVSRDPRVVAGKDFSLRMAYDDVFGILAIENTCSAFYGGPAAATTVLNQMLGHVERGQLPSFISFQMTGRPRGFFDPHSGASYRLFDKAIVNEDGAFYQRRFDPRLSQPRNVGSFPPGTRAARALILMHELAHLVKGRNGAWLIADDGTDSWQSKQNTAQIERRCAAQLRELD